MMPFSMPTQERFRSSCVATAPREARRFMRSNAWLIPKETFVWFGGGEVGGRLRPKPYKVRVVTGEKESSPRQRRSYVFFL